MKLATHDVLSARLAEYRNAFTSRGWTVNYDYGSHCFLSRAVRDGVAVKLSFSAKGWLTVEAVKWVPAHEGQYKPVGQVVFPPELPSDRVLPCLQGWLELVLELG